VQLASQSPMALAGGRVRGKTPGVVTAWRAHLADGWRRLRRLARHPRVRATLTAARRRAWWLLIPVAALLVALAIASVPPTRRANQQGTFSFAALGDAPYSTLDERQYPVTLADIDRHDLGFVVHVGDIMAGRCTDDRYRKSLDWFNGLRHPVIYTPGDNEWSDCGYRGGGSFAIDRLQRLRQLFFSNPPRTLGGRQLPLISQAAQPGFGELVENQRWQHQGIIFATVHIVGSRNGLGPRNGPALSDPAEVGRRTEAAAAWVRDTFAGARGSGAPAVVIVFHAFPFFEQAAGDQARQPFEPFLLALEEEVERFARPVLAVHGDFHDYTVDQPMVRRTTGRRLTNFTRLQVPGSPDVGWVRVVVSPGAAVPFSFESRVVPRWRFW
jgi:hypothetical protein